MAGTPIVYDPWLFPYYFTDSDADGKPDKDDTFNEIRYNAWTPRLLRAAYNYHFSIRDPGAYAHGGNYVIQLLYDSIEDLNQAVSTPIDLGSMNRPS